MNTMTTFQKKVLHKVRISAGRFEPASYDEARACEILASRGLLDETRLKEYGPRLYSIPDTISEENVWASAYEERFNGI